MNSILPNVRRRGRSLGHLLLLSLLITVLSGCVDPATGDPIPPLFAVPSASALPSGQPGPETGTVDVEPTVEPTVESTVINSTSLTPTLEITDTLKITDSLEITTPLEVEESAAISETEALTSTVSEPAPVETADLADSGPPTASILTNRGNIRGGPGTNNPVVAVGQKGETYQIVARDETGNWWQVCCVDGERRAWLAASIVAVTGNIDNLPVSKALFAEDFAASWQVGYTCDSDRCAVAACSGTMSATALQFVRTTFLEIDRRVEWTEGCGDNSYWLHQVDNFSGQERYTLAPDSPLFRYWIGALPGPANDTITLADGRTVDVICAGPFTQENDEGGGWTSVYTGTTCHDVRTGMIITMQYDKQWLFTGEFEGKSYSREFFGDQESYRLVLVETNAELAEK